MKLLDTYTDPAEIRSDFSYYAAPWTLVPREWENEKPNFRPQLTVPLQHRQLQYQVRAVCLSKQTNRQTKQTSGLLQYRTVANTLHQSLRLSFASEKCQKYV